MMHIFSKGFFHHCLFGFMDAVLQTLIICGFTITLSPNKWVFPGKQTFNILL